MPSVRGTVTYRINWNFKFYFPFNFRAQSLINYVRSSRVEIEQTFDFEGWLCRARWNKIRSKTNRSGGRAEDGMVNHSLSLVRRMIGGESNESTRSALRNGATTKLCYVLRVLNYLRNVYNALLPSLQEVRLKFLIAFTSFQFVDGYVSPLWIPSTSSDVFAPEWRPFLKTNRFLSY